MLGVKERNEILFRDYPECKVTEESVKFIKDHPQYYSGNVKLMQGKIYTNEEFHKRRTAILNYRLPR